MLQFLSDLFNLKGGKAEKSQAQQRFFFVLNSKIVHKDETRSGFIENIEIEKGTTFREIHVVGFPIVEVKQYGISRVTQHLELSFDDINHFYNDLKSYQENDQTISVLHLDKAGNCSLYGENRGLKIIELKTDRMILDGEEFDTFFNVSLDYLRTLV